MAISQPETSLDSRFSDPTATARSWADAVAILDSAETYWVTTVRSDRRPHVTPIIAIWLDDALYFCTGPSEQKAKNLASNPSCILSTGNSSMSEGFDVVLEGEAERVTNEALLHRLAAAYKTKYGWDFEVRGTGFYNEEGGEAYVFRVAPQVAFGFARGASFSQTRWRFNETRS